MTVSRRMAGLPSGNVLAEAHFRCCEDLYSAETNPNGFVNLGTAEHALLCPQVYELLQNAPVCSKEDLQYQCLHGKEAVRVAVAGWLSGRAGRPLNPENIVLAAGVTSLIECLGFALCDPGDTILIPAPCYSGFAYDLESRAGVRVEYVPCLPDEGFILKPERVLKAIGRAKENGRKVTALLLHNPANPTGLVMASELLAELVVICQQAGIALVVDEVCSDTVFSEKNFCSALNYSAEHVHCLYSPGKGMGVTGLAVGVFYSEDPELVNAVVAQASFSRLPNNVQTQVHWLLEQPGMTDLLGNSRLVLHQTVRHLTEVLTGLGIEVLMPVAGVFVWINLGAVFEIASFSEERRLFERLLNEARLNISPGQFFNCPVPGWFRLCYSVAPNALQHALGRLSRFVLSNRKNLAGKG